MNAFGWYTRFLVAVLALQFYAAGLALFGAASFMPHALLGWSFIVLSVVLAIWALILKARRVLGAPSAGVLFLAIAQPVIVFGLRRWPFLAALHPVVGLGIVLLVLRTSTRARTLLST